MPIMNKKKIIQLTGRNFAWASEMTGKTREELEILWLRAKMEDVVCKVVVL